MDHETPPSDRPVIPPPDLPKPPPPREKLLGPPPIKVHIKEPGGSKDEVEDDGLAPLDARIKAALIDVVVAAGLVMSAWFILPSFAERIAWVMGLAYLVIRDSVPFLAGQSVGKKALKLRVVTSDEKPLTGNWEPALIRNGVLLIPFFVFIELFVLLTREDKPGHGLRLGDEWAKTKVIVEPVKPATEGDAA